MNDTLERVIELTFVDGEAILRESERECGEMSYAYAFGVLKAKLESIEREIKHLQKNLT
jgi:hypothetical protein